MQRSWNALYGSQILQRLRGLVTLQKRPPGGRSGAARRRVPRLDSAHWGWTSTAAPDQNRRLLQLFPEQRQMPLHDLIVAPALAQPGQPRIQPVEMRRAAPVGLGNHHMKRLA